MTERELREKLQSAYGTMPDATRAAFEHSLTHHRVETRNPVRMSRRMRTIVTLALMLMMLTAVGVAAAKLASVTDYPPPSGLTPEYMSHLVTLNEAYDGDLLTLSVNDLVFDGTTVDVAMNVQPKAGKQVFMDMEVTAECAGRAYTLEIEGCGGGDFMSGMFLPDGTDSWSDSPFGFDGVLWDDDMQSPPEGVPIAWTMTFELLQPVWKVEYLPDAQYQALLAGGADTLEAYVQNNWRQQIITVTYGSLVEYQYAAEAAMLADGTITEPLSGSRTEQLLSCGGFRRADTIIVQFTTDFADDYAHPELVGKRIDMGDYDLVIDNVNLSFMRANITMHYEFSAAYTEDEIRQMTNLPNAWRVYVNGQTEAGYDAYANFQQVTNGTYGVDTENHALTVRFDDEKDAEYTGQQLEDLDLAYCLSVHKSQGSEFPVVILPVVYGPMMLLTRNLFYTALTRARKLVVLVGREEIIRQMVENDHIMKRYTTLSDRLRQVATMLPKVDVFGNPVED